jgi:hypothetical protein
MSKKNQLSFIIGFLLLVFVIPTSRSLADVAPPQPPVGSDISPGNELTQVRMVSEYVVLSIHSDPDYPWGRADITATFNMFNTGEEDEYMRVRYPMHHNIQELDVFEIEEGCGVYPGTPVKDLQVWVDDEPVAVDVEYETTIDYEASNREEREITMDIPCWGHFNVYFPAQKPVKIDVSYHVSGYERGSGGTNFDYIIGTGAGWKDTIGSATIVARFPYPLSDLNFNGCWPDNCEISGWEVIWRFEDFEPENTVGLNAVNPSIWDQVIIEKKNIEKNPQDGEAWGRLAKAYKESILDRKGFLLLNTQADQKVYNLSFSAYQKVIELLPNDPDWQYGFTELACKYTFINHLIEDENVYADWVTCVNGIKKVLELDPDHIKANEWLQNFVFIQDRYDFSRQLIEMSGSTPDFVILTPQANSHSAKVTNTTQHKTQTPTPTRQISITPTITSSPNLTPTISAQSTQPVPTAEEIGQVKMPTRIISIVGFVVLGIGVSILVFQLIKWKRPKIET